MTTCRLDTLLTFSSLTSFGLNLQASSISLQYTTKHHYVKLTTQTYLMLGLCRILVTEGRILLFESRKHGIYDIIGKIVLVLFPLKHQQIPKGNEKGILPIQCYIGKSDFLFLHP